MLEALDLLAMLQRPGAVEDAREIMKRLLRNPARAGEFNATVTRIQQADPKAEDADPFARLLSDPSALAQVAEDPQRAQELLSELNTSAIFEDMRRLGSIVLEQMRIAKLEAGTPVQILGLRAAAELNGRVGLLAEPTREEAAAHPERRVVDLGAGERVAVLPENLAFPRHAVGDAVLLEAEFAGEEEGLEGRAAVVSELTEEEQRLGFETRGGRVVVDVLPLIVGGPVMQRLLMWPEHLRPRTFQPGDTVRLDGLESDATLNGMTASVVPADEGEIDVQPDKGIVVALEADGRRLSVRRKNLRLIGTAAPAPWRGFG